MKKCLMLAALLLTSPALAEQVTAIGPNPTATGLAVTGQIPGTTTNDSAAAGNVGEYISSTVLGGSAVGLTSGAPADITSISLTAGDWNVWGSVWFLAGGSTTSTQAIGWISLTSATTPTAPNNGAEYNNTNTNAAGSSPASGPVGMLRISVATTTTVYLSARSTFAVSTMGAYGFIGARRAR